MRGLVLILVLFLAVPALAHTPELPSPSASVETEEAPSPGVMAALLGHPHNKLVHFPVAIAFVAFLFSLLMLRLESFETPLKVLVLLGFLAAVAAVLAGESQKATILQPSLRPVLQVHELLGWSIATVYGIWTLLAFRNLSRRWHWVFGLLVVLLVSVAGFLGGRMAHP